MKYGILFSVCGLLLVVQAVAQGSWWWIGLWPAISLLVVGVAYFRNSPSVFGKRSDGTRDWRSSLLLFPYLAFLWLTWQLIRVLSSEHPYDRVSDRLLIGRRLLPSEFPDSVDNVVDLTCEFSEPSAIRTKCNYLAVPILDAMALDDERLLQVARQIDSLDGVTLIHCAQGHGRTGLVAAAILLRRSAIADEPVWNGEFYVSQALSVDEAIAQLQEVRPRLNCNSTQIDALVGLLIRNDLKEVT